MAQLPDGMPIPVSKLPLNKVGYPVPWFVARPWETDTKDFDFRVLRRNGIEDAYNGKLCWVCGEERSGMDSFVIGPMCAVNHVSAEPPSHPGCALWSAKACPFLSRPEMVRRERGMPENFVEASGVMIKRNPGVTLVWNVRAKDWSPFSDGRGGFLFDIGEARSVKWIARGREATREEVLESIDSGFPVLLEQAVAEHPDAVVELNERYVKAMELVPA